MTEKMKRIFNDLNNYEPEQAIKIYDNVLKDNPKHLAALNNRGFCKMKLAVQNENIEILTEAISDFENAIIFAKEADGHGYPFAENNLISAKELLESMKNPT